jgi:hypothetical protein
LYPLYAAAPQGILPVYLDLLSPSSDSQVQAIKLSSSLPLRKENASEKQPQNGNALQSNKSNYSIEIEAVRTKKLKSINHS